MALFLFYQMFGFLFLFTGLILIIEQAYRPFSYCYKAYGMVYFMLKYMTYSNIIYEFMMYLGIVCDILRHSLRCAWIRFTIYLRRDNEDRV